MKILQLLRWPNLAITALLFLLFKIGFLDIIDIQQSLNVLSYTGLALSVILIMAGGYIINDIEDLESDKINKPNKLLYTQLFSEEKAQTLYRYLTFSGIILGVLIGYFIGYISFGFIHILAALLLWWYSTDLKKKPLIGNLTVAFVTALSILIIPIFNLIPAATSPERETLSATFYIFLAYGLFSFLISLSREIIKDLEDVQGDKKVGYRTTAIAFSNSVSKGFSIVIQTTISALLGFVVFFLWGKAQIIPIIYLILFLIAPIIFGIVLTAKATSKNDFHKLSLLHKWIMLSGIISILAFYLAVKISL